MKNVLIVLFTSLTNFAFAQPISAPDAATYKEKVLYSFAGGMDGATPLAGLINVNDTLYGTTAAGGGKGCGGGGCGTVFSIDLSTGIEKTLYSFCSKPNCADGAIPYASLLDLSGNLYGTTYVGGVQNPDCSSFGCGTVFSLDLSTGAEKVLYSFCSQSNCTDGALPDHASLFDIKGLLYSTTTAGGVYGFGTVFALDENTDAEKVIYSFCSQPSCPDGQQPIAALIEHTGMLYGTTPVGGNGNGTAFALDQRTGVETVLYTFGSKQNGTDGSLPFAALIDEKGILYGTTDEGGTGTCQGYGCGTVFALDRNTGAETVLYSFSGGTDGAYPQADLLRIKGTLYGTTYAGGGSGCGLGLGCGTVFSVERTTGGEKVLYSFCKEKNCRDGATPDASLIAVNGKLYGTTEYGGGTGCGGGGCGTVFVLEKAI